ncbi:PadR family transcriptional regulator [Chryseomicrobium palamuruense]|uniref:PadR family transcriptional regulator n=1 Tax=Chryseomicrobium palamuruense TaxID=682973 RepID=A0ABV8UYD7_9BACL
MNIQFKKGVLNLCVLALVEQKDRYGYELVQTISKQIELSEGAVYPLLRKLTAEGYFETYLMDSVGGPPRKYYRMTEQGTVYCLEQKEEWETFVKAVQHLLQKGDEINE